MAYIPFGNTSQNNQSDGRWNGQGNPQQGWGGPEQYGNGASGGYQQPGGPQQFGNQQQAQQGWGGSQQPQGRYPQMMGPQQGGGWGGPQQQQAQQQQQFQQNQMRQPQQGWGGSQQQQQPQQQPGLGQYYQPGMGQQGQGWGRPGGQQQAQQFAPGQGPLYQMDQRQQQPQQGGGGPQQGWGQPGQGNMAPQPGRYNPRGFVQQAAAVNAPAPPPQSDNALGQSGPVAGGLGGPAEGANLRMRPMADGGTVTGGNSSPLASALTGEHAKTAGDIPALDDGGSVTGSPWLAGLAGGLQGIGGASNPQSAAASNIGKAAGGIGRYIMNKQAQNTINNAPTNIVPGAHMGEDDNNSMPGMDDAGNPVPAMAAGGTVLGPREPQQDPGLPGANLTEPGAAMRRYSPVNPVAPKPVFGPKPEEMGHHLPTRLRIGKRINVRLPRPTTKGLGAVKMG